MQDIFVGRQPIYNRNLGIFAYEMLFRTGKQNLTDGDTCADSATSQVIINTFLDMGLDNLVGTALACINLSERFLISEDALPLPPERVVLDIQPNIQINDSTLAALQRLKKAGFTLALEDFREIPNFAELLKVADIFKLDIRQGSKQENRARIKELKKFDLKVLAEKVETLDEYEEYMDLGFDFFQGYFLSRPRIIKGKALATNKLSVMNLLSTMHNASSNIDAIEKAISSDVTLSYKLLKLINSAFFNLPNDVDSVKRAVVLLGRRKLSSWASMLALSSIDDKPVATVKISMMRAKACELIAEKLKLKDEDQYFTAGMFSALDLLMDRELDSLVNPLPLAENIKQGILEHKGNIGVVVKCSKLLETSAADKLSIGGISNAELSKLYLEADRWATEVTQSIR